MRGMEMLMSSMLKGMGLEPEKVMESIAQITALAFSVDQRLARMEAKLDQAITQKDGAAFELSEDAIIINGAQEHGTQE